MSAIIYTPLSMAAKGLWAHAIAVRHSPDQDRRRQSECWLGLLAEKAWHPRVRRLATDRLMAAALARHVASVASPGPGDAA